MREWLSQFLMVSAFFNLGVAYHMWDTLTDSQKRGAMILTAFLLMVSFFARKS